MNYVFSFFRRGVFASSAALWLVVLICLAGCKGCFDPKPIVEIKKPIKAPVGIAFIDGDFAAAKNVPEVKVTVIDSLGKVLSSNGISFKEITVTGGVMSVGLDESAEFSIEKPYRFFVRAEARGYMTAIRPVVITEDAPNYVPVYMAALDNPPSSGLVSSVSNIEAIIGGKLQSDQTITARQRSGQSIVIEMEAGTQMLCEGKPVEANGPLSYRLLWGSARDSSANRVFPGGFEATDAVDASGAVLATPSEPLFFTTAGWFSMEMNIGDLGVNGFSKPLTVDMPIADSVFNPLTSQFVSAGDTIPLWSLNNQTGIWTQDAFTVVTKEGEQLKARFQVSHLSDWNMDYGSPKCTGTIRLSYTNSDFNGPGTYYTNYIRVSDGAYLLSSSINLAAGGPLNIVRAPQDESQLLIHQDFNPTSPAYGISTKIICSDGNITTGSISKIVSGAPGNCVLIEFRRQTNAGFISVCKNSVWHKDRCSDPVYNLANFTGSAAVIIPRFANQNQKCLRLWFVNNNIQRALDFQIDLNSASETGVQGSYVESGGGSGTFLFNFTRTSIAPCNTKIQIDIPDNIIIGGNACP